MNQLKPNSLFQSLQPSNTTLPSNRPQPNSSQRSEVEIRGCNAARKTQKADREKLRRDRLNEQFIELGNAIDPDRPKNDKGTILADTIQLLKDLNANVEKLKAEYTTLTEESRELTQEKNDLREEKASLKSDIENLNAQYQQRLRAMFPLAYTDHSVVMGPHSYPFPVLPPGPIPVYPSVQPYPFFGNQNLGIVPTSCSTFVPYFTPTTQQPGNHSHISNKRDFANKSSGESIEGNEDSNDVVIDLELKTPGSTVDQDFSSGRRKSKKSARKEKSISEGSSSSRCSSSRSVKDSSSDSIVGGTEVDD